MANRVYILTDIELDYPVTTIDKIVSLYKSGADIKQIAKETKISTDAIALIIFDRARQGIIEGRKSGIYGCCVSEGR